MSPFSEVVDAADKLSLDEQLALVHILNQRIMEQNRRQLVADVAEAQAEFAAGKCQVVSADQLMNEIES